MLHDPYRCGRAGWATEERGRMTLAWPVSCVAVLSISAATNAIGEAARPWWNPRWEHRVALDIEKEMPQALSRHPLTITAGFLDLPAGTNWRSIRVIDQTGGEVPAQVDDLNGDGKIAGADELAFVADLRSACTRYYVYVSEDARVGRGTFDNVNDVTVSFDDGAKLSFDNGRIRLRDGQFEYRLAGQERWLTLLCGDGSFTFDAYNFGGSKITGWQGRIISRGPVRTIVRRVSTGLVATERGRERGAVIAPAQVTHEWHVYRRRKECFVSSTIENVTQGKDVLLVARGWTWLAVTPGGQYTSEDFWTAAVQGKRETHQARAGLRTKLRLSENWIDAYSDGPTNKPRANVGLVFHPLSSKYRLWAGERDARFRFVVMLGMNWPRVPPNDKLWVGFWICPHEGGPDDLRQFCRVQERVDIIPGAIESRGSVPD